MGSTMTPSNFNAGAFLSFKATPQARDIVVRRSPEVLAEHQTSRFLQTEVLLKL